MLKKIKSIFILTGVLLFLYVVYMRGQLVRKDVTGYKLSVATENERDYLHESANTKYTEQPYMSGKYAPESPVFTEVKRFLNATPDTDDILAVLPVRFLKGVKNPCFALTNNTMNIGNINVSTAIANGYEIRCLPYFYLAGFTKCATSDMYTKLSMHPLITGGYRKLPTRNGQWREMLSVKEAHFWDNMYLRPNSTIDFYSKFYSSDPIVESFNKYGTMPSEGKSKVGDLRDLVYVDATPRTIWHGDTWDEDLFNIPLLEPDILLPHKLYHAQPNAKFIVSLRNPTDRLVSDFKFYYRGSKSPETFHSKVVDAIAWWNNCTQKMVTYQKACAYGKAPKDLPELGFEICMRNKTFARNMRNFPYEQGDVCQSKNGWQKNVADRLRVGMYDLFIKDWLDIFPRENFLFVKFEDYTKEPAEYLERYVLPFLGLPPFTKFIKQYLSQSKNINTSRSKIVISPEIKDILDKFYKNTKQSLAKLLKDEAFLWDD